jgi:hypothetical protein
MYCFHKEVAFCADIEGFMSSGLEDDDDDCGGRVDEKSSLVKKLDRSNRNFSWNICDLAKHSVGRVVNGGDESQLLKCFFRRAKNFRGIRKGVPVVDSRKVKLVGKDWKNERVRTLVSYQ